ncbi:hypothetical protein CDHC01_1389 [Corynebacterium diphtheriae HC01]|uniref:hypothetical protein n=1 Tax=Corynebacterium diphtheriae TaxID=1717 RepID=UPI000245AE17|nr:hypothetical protein [Corynebacterium diphtheriae]AEX44450.1 hypothetical protein CD241_1390 [Corynebacterium diphtheriae 241]AEX74635.1 hypothetical protein CDHC01_1389 [Corynebacterium diphtheriae HC01]
MGSEADVIHNMFSTDPTWILLVPSGPVVITELSPFEPISQLIRTAVDDILHELNPKTIRIIFSLRDAEYTAHTGSFRAWGGRKTAVSAGNYLPELVVRFLIGRYLEHNSNVEVLTGSGLRDAKPNELIVYAVDGPAALTQRAPLGFNPKAAEFHDAIVNCLSQASNNDTVEPTWLQSATKTTSKDDLLRAGVVNPSQWLELFQYSYSSVQLLLSDSTLGVGRYVALLQPCS